MLFLFFKSCSLCWKGFKYAEDAGQPKPVHDLEDFLKSSGSLTAKTAKALPDNRWVTFEWGHLCKFSYIILPLWANVKSVILVKLLTIFRFYKMYVNIIFGHTLF